MNIAEDHKGKPKEQTRRISTETVRKKSPLKKEVEKKKKTTKPEVNMKAVAR